MSDDVNPNQPPVEVQSEEPTQTFTQDDVNRIVGQEKARLKAQYEKQQADYTKTYEENARIAGLKGEERARAEAQREHDQLVKERDELKRNLAIANASAQLSSLGLDPAFAENLIGPDEDVTKANVERFNQMVQSLVAKQVQGNLHRGAPPDPQAGGKSSDEFDEERFLNRHLREVAGLK